MLLGSAQPNPSGQSVGVGRESALSGETLARRALEGQRGKAFSDKEWQKAKGRLLAFARLVQTWTTSR